ncbi:hypothetical protein H0H93_009184 [Arthromyces matolae]|nr:hypothetical protein H0H93_009184 [Arthromyces matolae]
MPSSSSDDNPRNLEIQRQKYKQKLASAITDDDDPLAVYNEFVQWTVKNYGENDPRSGLRELLGQATKQFMRDPMYKTDIRYLKLWTLYAGQVDRASAIDIYANLLANEIGTSFSLLYEGYASLLEAEGRQKDVEVIYRQGIRRQARPFERLKKGFQEFQNRISTASADRPQRALPNRPISRGPSASSSATSISTSQSLPNASTPLNTSGTAEHRYNVMLAPPDPGKRREHYRFDMSMLFTQAGGEFSIEEARARNMGLLGKKWPPPLPDSFQSTLDASSDSISMPVDFNDDGSKNTTGGRRRSMFAAEPTVTINTRAALDDVFGMYNSPDRTTMLGSKYGPLRQVRPSAVGLAPTTPNVNASEDSGKEDGKTPAFRPFVDENANSNRTPSIRFQPFVDENKAPSTTPRLAFSLKDPSQEKKAQETPQEANPPSVFSSRVFTPVQTKLAPLSHASTESHGKPQPEVRLDHERAKSQHEVPSPESGNPVRTFTPFVDENAQTPFKVFSRPPDQPENVFTPKTPATTFTPFVDPKPTFTPFRDVTPAFTSRSDQPPEVAPPSEHIHSRTVVQIEEDSIENGQESSQYDDDDDDDYSVADEGQGHYEVPLETVQETEEDNSYQEIPLGGRFGRFNVMTPITERTFEFTTSTRGSATPSEPTDDLGMHGVGNVFTPLQRDQHDAVIAAERLAAELRDDEPLEPLRLSAYLPPKESPDVTILEDKTGTLSLGDSLTSRSQFRPSNPCNPFDPLIVANILSRIPSDPYFYDFRDRDSRQLDGLQKFAKKGRKSSGSGPLDVSGYFSLELNGHKFNVTEKLGEGGFGAVFKARDVGAGSEDDEELDEDFDDDEENMSLVALKVVKPRNLWEYHVLRRLHSALPSSSRQSIILPHALYAFRDESFLVLDLCPQGTLLNIVNNAGAAGVSQQGACLDELLVIFFTVELLRLLDAIHSAGFIHGDLKIDNCLLRLEDVPGGASAWSSSYSPSGDGGWSFKGLKVIDFGRTIDTKLFPSGQLFLADWPTDDRDCFEARQDKPWTFQTDYYGLAGIVYCMLFGKYIYAGAIDSSSGRHKLATPLKRYWQTEVWNRLFDILLNPTTVRPDGQLPVSNELGVLRKEMEIWLQSNCNRASGTLKGLLKKVEVSCYKGLG